MTSISKEQIELLKVCLAQGMRAAEALPRSVGRGETVGGLWRFFSNDWPSGGIRSWNEGSWRKYWKPFLPAGLYSVGEDVFGNQLALVPHEEQVLLWNHETGECSGLFVGPLELLQTALQDGVDWVDLYSDGCLSIAREFGAVPMPCHLHWRTPLFLGGAVSLDNATLEERESHLIGHAKLASELLRPNGSSGE